MNELIETDDESASSSISPTARLRSARTRITIDKYVYDNRRSCVKMTKGAFRFVSGSIPKENVTPETPTVTIGIRGTELVFDVADDGETEISTVSGEADY
jgi:hypothetical protein